MNKKLCIVTDLDGTFLNSESQPAPRNLEAIERFKTAGNYFTIATGRYAIKWSKYANAPVILCNGAFMFDPSDGKILNKRSFDGAPLYKILEKVHDRFPKCLPRYTDDRDIHYLKFDGSDDIGDKWYKVVFESQETDPNRDTKYKRADLSDICEYLQESLGELYRYNFSSPWLFEVLQNNASKGISIGDLKEYFKARGEEVTIYAAGDYENDIEMLDAADVAVCPCNALPSVREMLEARKDRDGSAIIAADNDYGTIYDLICKIM